MEKEIENLIYSKTASNMPKFLVMHEMDFNIIFLKGYRFFKVLRGNKNQIRQYHFAGVKIIRTQQDIKIGTLQPIY